MPSGIFRREIALSKQKQSKEKFVKREDPYGNNYYWLTGNYVNNEPQATDTDEAMMAQGYVSVVPCKIDLTDYDALEELKRWNYEAKI